MDSFGPHRPSVQDEGVWLTKERAARYMEVSARTIQRWISDGTLDAYRSGRLLRLRRTDLDALLKASLPHRPSGDAVGMVGASPAGRASSSSGMGTNGDEEAIWDLGIQARNAGILRIFKSRVEDPEYKSALAEALRGMGAGDTADIMSNSLRFLFGHQVDPQLIIPVNAALRRDVRFRVVLLDPTSPAAKRRAEVEEQDRPERYGETQLFFDITTVARTLRSPDPRTIRDEELRRRLSDREQVQVRFSKADPSTHLVVTKNATFVENYHTGGNQHIQERLAEMGLPNLHCFGGFVTTFMYDNRSLTAELMKSHFNNVWEKAEHPTLDEVLDRENDPAVTSWSRGEN